MVQIYSFVIPPFVDFQLLKLRKRLWGWDKEEFHDEKYKFHERCANRVFVDYLQRTTPESQYLVGDAHDADCAIVACSGAWLERCGYGEDEVIGRGCRHLQGPETCARAVAAMGEAMGRDGQCATSLINYHADGSKFQNDFILVPLTSLSLIHI